MVASGYARIYQSNAVLTASPGQLVLMLLDGALKALDLAQEGFARPADDRHRIPAIHQQLLKAQRIFAELQGGLDLENGGEFAATMNRLYSYYNARLLEANLRKQPAPVEEVIRLVRPLRDAWAEMLSGAAASTPELAGAAR